MNEKNKKWTLVALFLGLLEILFIDAMSSIVGPGIVADLGDTSLYAFMYTLTFLCNTLALPITSMLGNKSGRKYIIIAGAAVYGISTVLAGMANNMMFHVVMRGLQGIGKGCILGNVLAYFGESLDEQGRAKAMGFYGTLTGIVFLVAPLAGGAIGDLLGWRLTFYISIPLTVIVLAVLLLKMPQVKPNGDASKLDWAGTLYLSLVTIGIVMFFSWGGQKYSWLSVQVIGAAVVCLVSLVLFIRHINHCDAPVLSPKLFKNREFVLVILGVPCKAKLAARLRAFAGSAYVVCDSAEPKSIADLRRYGVSALPARKGPDSLMHGVQWLRAQEIVVDPRCRNLIRELTLYQWQRDREGNTLRQPRDRDNHLIDALRYALEGEMEARYAQAHQRPAW